MFFSPLRRIVSSVGAMLASVALLSPGVRTDDFGHFVGAPITITFLAGGGTFERRARLVDDLTYVDPAGRAWTVEKGFVTDGASIPRAFWTLVGGPFDGSYRDAAVVHDKYCVTHDKPWRAVHRMFYYAMRAAGVGEVEALTLYGGVMAGGPRWEMPPAIASAQGTAGEGKFSNFSTRKPILQPGPALTANDASDLKRFVTMRVAFPTLDELDDYAEQTRDSAQQR
jgi:hypothetical protein